MEKYKLMVNKKGDDKYRLSFNRLANETFGIDFEKWYQAGCWNGHYVPYSYMDGDRVIANVSVNTMELIAEGKVKKAIQIGTVMTHPAYRRQGLALDLMNRALADYEESYDFFFLAADEQAIPLYEKCGFRLVEEYRFEVQMQGSRKTGPPLKRVGLSVEEFLETQKNSVPVTQILSCQNDEHVAMFYYFAGFKDILFQADEETVVIAESEGESLHLYAVYSPKKVDLEKLINRFAGSGIGKVVLYFTPDGPLENLHIEVDSSSRWMVRSSGIFRFPEPSRFPLISQT